MKIILRSDVDNLGRFGDVVKVAPGYARNYLLPRGMAVPATPGNVRHLESEKEAWNKKSLKSKEDAEKVKADLEKVELSFARRAGDDDKLFGSVTSMDIEAALKDKGFKIERKNIVISEQIKHLGAFTVRVRLHHDVKAELKVAVVKE